MRLSVDKRYEIIFLSHHLMGPQLGVKAVAKAIKCAKSTVQDCLNRWKESKDLSDSKRIGRPRSTTKKVGQRISDLATTNTRAIQRVLKRKNVDISQETIRRRLKEYGAKFSLPISKPVLTEKHRQKRSDRAHAAGDMVWNRIILTTVRLNQLKRCVWNLPGKRKVFRTVKYPIKVNIWGCFSCNGFGRICCFRENLKVDLLCRIYKRYLLPTTLDEIQLIGPYKKIMVQSTHPSWQNNEDRSMKSNESIGHQCHQTSIRSKTFGNFSK